MLTFSNINNLGKLIIISGISGSGKGSVTKILNNYFLEKNLLTTIMPTGMFFRAISRMIILIGKTDFLVNEKNPDKIAELILPILDPKNWKTDSNGIINLTFENKVIRLDDQILMTNEVSNLISTFTGISKIREKLFGKNLIGKIIEESLNLGKIVLYDARFTLGEFDFEDLKFLYKNKKLIIFEIKVTNEALKKISVFRTIDAIGKEKSTEDEIEKTYQQILLRSKSDEEKGIVFPEKFVKENFPNSYFIIENDGNGLKKLEESVLEKL